MGNQKSYNPYKGRESKRRADKFERGGKVALGRNPCMQRKKEEKMWHNKYKKRKREERQWPKKKGGS